MAWNLFAAAIVLAISIPFLLRLDAVDAWRHVAASIVFANCIGTPVGLMVGSDWFKGVHERIAAPMNWAVAILAILITTTLGCTVASALLVAIGLYPMESFSSMLVSSVVLSCVVSLLLGLGGFMHDKMKAKVERAELHARTLQLAEEQARAVAAEARLASLESRVHPHFLFNTLNSIAALIQEDPDRAEETVGRLASLLRFSLDSAGTVSLERELEIVEKYLEIESVRYGKRLRYTVERRPGLEAVDVPALSVQTLVENGVKHVASARREGAEIVVGVTTSEGRVRIDVRDDGPGFEAEAITSGHGLDIVRGRLNALYGEDGRLGISRADGWTVVSLDLPVTQP